ncbi:unnamed protein product, partial [Vitis vinifera]|uniref:Staygreen protein domain-containing protein n=1 Tax=Vitis vinifera TaxID=29760 RepID=E0CQZ1_VITVI
MGEEIDNYSGIIPRVYTLSHCDFTANLTLTISNIISLDQLKGWYNKFKHNLYLYIHCSTQVK